MTNLDPTGTNQTFNWKQFLASALAGLSSGLGTAGQGQGFGPGFAQGQMAWQQQQGELQRQRMVQQQFEMQRQQFEEQQRRAQAEQAQKETAKRQIAALLGGAPNNGRPGGPGRSAILGGYTPDQSALLQTSADIDPMGTLGMLTEQAFKQPSAAEPPVVKDFYEGGQVVQKQWNPQTGTWEQVGAGPRWQPQQAADGGPKTSLVPFYTTDAQGKIHMFQPTASGVPVEVQLPPGMSPTKPLSFQDLGTSIVGVQPLGGQPAMSLPKDIAGAAEQKTIGEATGKAKIDLPGVEANADYIKQTIQGLIDAPGREAATGTSGFFNPLLAYDGSERKDFLVRRDQLKGQAFLNAYDSLKGGGQITEVEGAKAEAAKARLDTAQSDAEFLAALKEFQVQVDKLVDLARKKAGGGVVPQNEQSTPASNAPAPGTIEGGYRFKGGDPANPSNWEKVN